MGRGYFSSLGLSKQTKRRLPSYGAMAHTQAIVNRRNDALDMIPSDMTAI